MFRLLIALAGAAATLGAALPARAYCRTTTTQIPAGYDPTLVGCIGQGTSLAWPSMPVTYQIEREASLQVPLDVATAIIDQSFAKWAAVTCVPPAPAGQPAVSFRNLGPTGAGFMACDGGPCGGSVQDAPHVVLFRDANWPYSDPSNTLALTTITFGVETGRIFAADMEINSVDHAISTVVPPPAGSFSLEAIVTHEAGHFIGIAHSMVDTAVMFAHYQPGAVELTTDDIAAVCAAYPPSHGKSGCSFSGMSRDGWGAGATMLLVLTAALARRRQTAARTPRR